MAPCAVGERSRRIILADRRRHMSHEELHEVAMNLNDRNAELEGRILELRNLESMEVCIEMAKRLGIRVVEELAGFCRSEQEASRTAWVPSSSITYSHNDFIESAKRLCPILFAFLSSISDAAAGRERNAPEQRRINWIAVTVAAAAKLVDSSFEWAFAWHVAWVAKAVSNSKLVCNLFADFFGLGPNYKQLWRKEDIVATELQKIEPDVTEDYDSILILDNLQKLTRQAASTLASPYHVPVVTQLIAVLFQGADDKVGRECYQRDMSVDPTTFASILKTVDPKTMLATADDIETVNTFVIERLRDPIRSELEQPNRHVEKSIVKIEKEDIVCDRCNSRNKPNKRVCYLCKAQLSRPTTSQNVPETFFQKRAKGKKRTKEDFEGDGAVVEILPPLKVNPNCNKTRKHAAFEAGKMAKVKGFCDDPKRSWCFLCTDQGASPFESLTPEEKEGPLSRLLHVPGGGHEQMCFARVVFQLAHHFGFEKVAEELGVKSKAQKERIFFVAGDALRQADALLIDKILVGFAQAAARYRANLPDCGSTHEEDLVEWCVGQPNVTLRELSKFVFGVIGAYATLRNALRTNSLESFLSARKLLMPFIFLCGRQNYAPLLLVDTANLQSVWPKPVMALRRKHFSMAGKESGKGQSWDFILEQTIQKIKSISSCSSFNSMVAGGAFANYVESLRDCLRRNLGTKFSEDGRTNPDYIMDQSKCSTYFLELFNRQEAPAEPLGADGEPLHSTLSKLREEADPMMLSYAKERFEEGKATLPPAKIQTPKF